MFLAYPLFYVFKYNLNVSFNVDKLFIYCICVGVSLLSWGIGIEEKSKVKKILFYYTIAIFNLSIVLTYVIDSIADPFFKATYEMNFN